MARYPDAPKTKRPASHYTTAQKKAEALKLRCQGVSLGEIAKRIEVSIRTAQRYIEDEMARLDVENREDLGRMRRIESMRLEGMLAAVWPRIRQGDTDAIMVGIKISERLSKLYGLDAPTRTQNLHLMVDGRDVTELARVAERMGLPLDASELGVPAHAALPEAPITVDDLPRESEPIVIEPNPIDAHTSVPPAEFTIPVEAKLPSQKELRKTLPPVRDESLGRPE